MWQIPHNHLFAKIKAQSRIRLIAVTTALVCHNWRQINDLKSI